MPAEELDRLIPKDFVRPDITVGNYFLKWDEKSYGVPRKEAPELKRFVADMASHLGTLYEAVGGVYKVLEKADAREARRIEEAFTPQILATRKRGDVVYNLQMKRDGATFIIRSEKIGETALTLSWILGELVFDRQKNA